MIVWSNLETSCPMCQRRLRVREVGGGFVTGQDTDLLIRMKGKHLVQAEIHTCRYCRFSGYTDDFTTRSITSLMVKRFFEEFAARLDDDPRNDSPSRRGTRKGGTPGPTPLPHLQYYWAAVAAPAIGLTPTQAGLRMARAYWCLRLQPSCRLPAGNLKALRKLYLRESISRLRQGLRFEKNRSSLVYLIGELCRRNTNYLLAKHYFERFLHKEKGPRYLKLAATKLLASARQCDASDKTMEDVLYGEPTDSKRGRRQDS